MQYTKEDIVKILTSLFLGTNKKIPNYITFKQRLLISSISSKNETAELLNTAIMALAEVTSDEDFTKAFISNKKESLSLLKLLFAYGSKMLLVKCVDNLRESLDVDNEFSSSLTALCRKYKLEKEVGKSTRSCNAMITELLKSKNNGASARSDLVQAVITKISKETNLTKLSKDKVIGRMYCWLTQFSWILDAKFVFFLSRFSFIGSEESQESSGRGRLILTLLYLFYPFYEHLHISWAVTAERSHLHVASDRLRIGNLLFLSGSR